MHPLRPILVCLLLLIGGCGRSTANYKQAVANAVKSEPNVAAFERLFPGSEHFISYYTGAYGTPKWNSKALIHGRYILTMQFDVAIDSGGTKVTAATSPQFYLVEVANVAPMPSGQTSITYTGASQRQFGLKEWKAIESSGGDLSKLGLNVVRDQPVPNLAANWRGA
jgi:hypothetical protein